MLGVTLFDISLPSSLKARNKLLILSGCTVTLANSLVFSELDELNQYALNKNDHNCGSTIIRMSFENNFSNPYFNFFIQCVTIRLNDSLLCKINKGSTDKFTPYNYTSVSKDGKMSLGLLYYFQTLEERDRFLNCDSFCIEGFIALKRKTNVYGFLCRVNKIDNDWKLIDGNTYRTSKNKSIASFYH